MWLHYGAKGSFYTGSVPFGTVPKWVRLGLEFTQDPLEPFQMELLAVPKWVHLLSRSHLESYPGRSRVNGWNGSKRERPGNDAAIHCLNTFIDKRRLKRWNYKNFRFFFEKRKTSDVCFERHLRFNKALATFWNRSRVNGLQWEQFQVVPISSIRNGSNRSRVNAACA